MQYENLACPARFERATWALEKFVAAGINCAMPKLYGLELFFVAYLKVRTSYRLN